VSGDVGEVSAVREVDDLACEFEETGGVAYLTVVMMPTKNSLMKRRASIPCYQRLSGSATTPRSYEERSGNLPKTNIRIRIISITACHVL